MPNDALYQESFALLRTSQLNEMYYREQGDLSNRLNLGARLVSAVSASVTVAGWVSSAAPEVWKAASVVAAVVAILNAVLRWDDRARDRRALATKWSGVGAKCADPECVNKNVTAG